MENLINEAQRMQQLAGILNESQLDEVDNSLLSGIAKNLYLYLSKMKPNDPLDVNGAPLKNVKGEPITHNKKVKMTYQNPKLATQGKAKDLGKVVQGGVITSNPEVGISYYVDIIFVNGFVKKEEAEAALKYILDKYPNQLTGLRGEPTVVAHKMDYEWAKNYAPTYEFELKLKSDKELAKAQSAKPVAPAPQAESLDIESVVNEALEAVREVAPAAPAPTNAPADVKALGKAQQTSTTVATKAKAINSIQEFPGAFENWFKTLGFQPGKVSKSAVRSEVEKILTKLGYK